MSVKAGRQCLKIAEEVAKSCYVSEVILISLICMWSTFSQELTYRKVQLSFSVGFLHIVDYLSMNGLIEQQNEVPSTICSQQY